MIIAKNKLLTIFFTLSLLVIASCGKKNEFDQVYKQEDATKSGQDTSKTAKTENSQNKQNSSNLDLDLDFLDQLSKSNSNTTAPNAIKPSSQNIEIALAVPDSSEDFKDIRRDLVDGSLLALKKIKSDKISIKPFQGRYDDQRQPYMMIGPWGRENSKEISYQKSEPYVNFALTNDIGAASENNIVTGLTPEQQAFFLFDFLPKFEKPKRVLLPEILNNLGYSNRILNALRIFEVQNIGRLFQRKDLSLYDLELDIDPNLTEENDYQLYFEEVMPIIVIGKTSSNMFEKFSQSLILKANDYRGKKSTNYFDYKAYNMKREVVETHSDKKFPRIIPIALDEDRSTWNSAISNILNYKRRLLMYQNEVKSVPNDKVRNEIKKYEILSPPPIAAIVITLEEPSDVTWIASLIDYYNNSWLKIPVFGMEAWQNSDSILRESSLKNSIIISHQDSSSISQQLDDIFYSSFKRYPSHFAKLSYDLVLLASNLNDNGTFAFNKLVEIGSFSGWSGSYKINSKGLLVHNLVLKKISNNRVLNFDYSKLKNTN